MAYIFDASFGHAQITPAAMKSAGADGVILYAGCNDTRKNATKAEIHALLDAGFTVGLVIENFATDAIGGAPVGDAQGRAILAAAQAVDYDTDNCVLFGGYDTDSHEADWPKLLAYMEAFAKHVPVPGFYGDSDAIDFLHARHPDWIYWQSDSRSFSPRNPTPNAHILQLFNDPRAHGLPVDVDIVERTPLRLMGEDVALTDADVASIWHANLTDSDGTTQTAATWLKQSRNAATNARDFAKANAQDIAAVQADLEAVKSAVATLQSAGVDLDALAKAVVAHLGIEVVSK